MTSAEAWAAAVLFALGWALAALSGIGHALRWIRKPPGPASTRVPGHPPAREYPPVPGPVPTPEERHTLDAIGRGRVATGAGSNHAAVVIADGLRLRFPGLDDITLGLVTLELFGYARTLAIGLPDPARAMQATVDALGLTAEELTRLARNGAPR